MLRNEAVPSLRAGVIQPAAKAGGPADTHDRDHGQQPQWRHQGGAGEVFGSHRASDCIRFHCATVGTV